MKVKYIHILIFIILIIGSYLLTNRCICNGFSVGNDYVNYDADGNFLSKIPSPHTRQGFAGTNQFEINTYIEDDVILAIIQLLTSINSVYLHLLLALKFDLFIYTEIEINKLISKNILGYWNTSKIHITIEINSIQINDDEKLIIIEYSNINKIDYDDKENIIKINYGENEELYLQAIVNYKWIDKFGKPATNKQYEYWQVDRVWSINGVDVEFTDFYLMNMGVRITEMMDFSAIEHVLAEFTSWIYHILFIFITNNYLNISINSITEKNMIQIDNYSNMNTIGDLKEHIRTNNLIESGITNYRLSYLKYEESATIMTAGQSIGMTNTIGDTTGQSEWPKPILFNDDKYLYEIIGSRTKNIKLGLILSMADEAEEIVDEALEEELMSGDASGAVPATGSGLAGGSGPR